MEQIKTLLLGMLLAVVTMLLLGAGTTENRYQIAGAGGTAYYVLDTHTGRVVAAGGAGPGSRGGSGWASAAVDREARY